MPPVVLGPGDDLIFPVAVEVGRTARGRGMNALVLPKRFAIRANGVVAPVLGPHNRRLSAAPVELRGEDDADVPGALVVWRGEDPQLLAAAINGDEFGVHAARQDGGPACAGEVDGVDDIDPRPAVQFPQQLAVFAEAVDVAIGAAGNHFVLLVAVDVRSFDARKSMHGDAARKLRGQVNPQPGPIAP